MIHLLQLVFWLWDRFTGTEGGDDGESTGRAYSLLDASLRYGDHPQRNGVRALQRANEQATELEAAHRENR